MRLKHRLSLALTVVTTTALASSFGVGYFLVYREEMRDLDQAVLAQARVAAFLVAKRDPAHPRVQDGLVDDPEIPAPTKRYVAVYAPTGEILSSTRSFGAQVPSLASLNIPESLEPEGAVRDLEIAKERLRGVVLPLADRRGRLLYAVSRHTVDEDLLFLFQVFLALMLGATALTALFARWLGSRLSADVDAIASVAREVASGNLRARVGRGARGSTETQALGGDLDQMVAELDRLMAAQQTFVPHAAHELRSPLATVRGELQLALRRPRSAEEYKASIEDALTEVEELIRSPRICSCSRACSERRTRTRRPSCAARCPRRCAWPPPRRRSITSPSRPTRPRRPGSAASAATSRARCETSSTTPSSTRPRAARCR